MGFEFRKAKSDFQMHPSLKFKFTNEAWTDVTMTLSSNCFHLAPAWNLERQTCFLVKRITKFNTWQKVGPTVYLLDIIQIQSSLVAHTNHDNRCLWIAFTVWYQLDRSLLHPNSRLIGCSRWLTFACRPHDNVCTM